MTERVESFPNRSPQSVEQRLELVQSLFSRPREEIRKLAAEKLQQRYPNAPESMISVANFHIYGDGIFAALHWLASAEILLQTGDDDSLAEHTYHLLYHLYNWQQFQELMPIGNQEILKIFQDMKSALADQDTDTVQDYLDDLEAMFGAHKMNPYFERHDDE